MVSPRSALGQELVKVIGWAMPEACIPLSSIGSFVDFCYLNMLIIGYWICCFPFLDHVLFVLLIFFFQPFSSCIVFKTSCTSLPSLFIIVDVFSPWPHMD